MFEINLLTIFPDFFSSFISSSLVHKSIERGLCSINVTNIRDFAEPPHYQVDDSPYGGGAGMVMMPGPLMGAIENVKIRSPNTHVVLLSASGSRFTQSKAEELSKKDSITLICGRYEGVDQRVIDLAVHEELSIGDYIVMGGEVPAMVVAEATLRLREAVLGNQASIQEESFSIADQIGNKLVEAPHYTRPAEFRGKTVPQALLSGNHALIAKWRKEESLARTRKMRPDLLATVVVKE